MQAMAHQQAKRRSPAPAEGEDQEQDSYPFSTLSVWRDKLQADLGGTHTGAAAGSSGGAAGGADYKLRLLLQQGKDVEQAVLGCLKDGLFDLHEGVVWGLLDPGYEQQQRQHLLNAAANELNTDKQLCLQLAREHDLLGRYAEEVKKPINHTVADYERVGELKFGLAVWRANLRRDASLAESQEELEQQLREGYADALRLIRRCGSRSQQFWAAQRAGGAPTHTRKRRLYEAAVQRVRNSLLDLAASHDLDPGTLYALFQELPNPDAVPLDEGDASPEAGGGRGDNYQPPGGEGGVEGGASRGSSEESETSALGL